jgi:branched-chain amino acid transport system permease protein
LNLRDYLFSPKNYVPLLLLIVAFLFPLVIRSPYILHVMIMLYLTALLAEAWNIVGGYAGQMSFGHTVFFGLGAYTSTLMFMWWRTSPWFGLVAGAIIAAISCSVLIPSLRLTGPFFALVSLATGETFRYIMLNLDTITLGPRGILIPFEGPSIIILQFVSKAPYYYIVLSLLLITIFITYMIEKSKPGTYFVAIREDQDAARSLGVDLFRYKLIAITTSAFFTGLAGVFYAQYQLYIDPYHFFSMNISVEMVVTTIFGGAGTVAGPIIGAVILAPISEVLRAELGGTYVGVHLIIYSILLIVTIIFQPGGVITHVKEVYASILKVLPQKHE